MAFQYANTLETSRTQAVLDAINAGSGAGVIEFGTTGMGSLLATMTLEDPAGTVAGDTLTFTGFPKEFNATGAGTAAEARIKDSTGTVVATGVTVGLTGSGSHIELDSVSFNTGQTVRLDSLVLSHF